jgi:hypothetical protein
MFSLHYPNVRLSEISNFGNLLKNDVKNVENAEDILKINNCMHNEQIYAIVKYDKQKLTPDLINTLGLFRSVILNSDGEFLSFSPPKSIPYKKFIEKYPKKDENVIIEEFVEGTMINVFWNKNVGTNGEWVISTKSNIGANTHFYKLSNSKTFNTMFFEALDNINFKLEQLNPLFCYSFVLQHPENRIVVKFNKPQLYLINIYYIDNANKNDIKLYSVNMIDVRKKALYPAFKFPQIYRCNEYSDIEFNDNLDKYLNIPNYYNVVGVVLYNVTTNERTKIRNPAYEYVRKLRGNQPKLQYHYLCLRKQNKVSEFLKYFSEYRKEFSEFQKRIHDFTDILYKNYVACYIKKEKPLIEFENEYRTNMYNIHQKYINELKEKKTFVNKQTVIEYVNNLHPSILMDNINYNLKMQFSKT